MTSKAGRDRDVIFSGVRFEQWMPPEKLYVIVETIDGKPDWDHAIYVEEDEARTLMAAMRWALDGPEGECGAG